MSDKTLAAYTPPLPTSPPYINVRRLEVDGSVQVTVRSESKMEGDVEKVGATAAITLSPTAWDQILDDLVASR